MTYKGFCGPSNPLQSVMADFERTVNWYPEPSPQGMALYPTPGLRALVAATDTNTRAIFSMAGRTFAVVGGKFGELTNNGATWTERGTVAQNGNPATISSNGTQLFITSGTNGYSFILATNTWAAIGALAGIATQGGMINSRFLAFNVLTGVVRLSGLNDVATWDPTLAFARSQAPDPWQAMIVSPPEIWLFGEQTGEVWGDAGTFPQPYAPIPGAFFEFGTRSPWSVHKAGPAMVWLSHNKDGAGTIVTARGYAPQEISNYGLATVLATYDRAGHMDNCEAFAYQDQGHLFSVFSFPDASATWAVDMATGVAHERGTWNALTGQYDVWAPRVHAHAFGKHLVGTRNSSSIAELSIATMTELDGGPIRRVRTGPPIFARSNRRLFVDRFSLDVEVGLGIAVGQGSDPMMACRTTLDGKTWEPERLAGAGAQGQYGIKVCWTRCGSSEKLWAPQVVVTDPIPWRLAGAELEGSDFQQMGQAA